MALENTKSPRNSDMNTNGGGSSENKRKCATPVVVSDPKSEFLECPFCSKKFPPRNTAKLAYHVRIHTGEKPYVCNTCKKGFSLKGNLQKHVVRIHGRQNKVTAVKGSVKVDVPKKLATPAHKMFTKLGVGVSRSLGNKKCHQCELCSKKFTLRSKLKRHLRTHTGEKPHICPVCTRGFSEHHTLKMHSLMHTGERPFKCEECDFAYVTESRLKFHKMRIHTGGKRKFILQKVKMRKPKVISNEAHTGEKPFVCTMCKRAFKRKETLQLHTMRIHTGERPFNCERCDQKFTKNSQLRQHKVNFHSVGGSSEILLQQSTSALDVGTGETRPPLNHPQSLSQEERAQQWTSFLNVFNVKISKN